MTRWILLLLFIVGATAQAQETVSLRSGWNGVAFSAPRLAELTGNPTIVGMAWYEGGAYRIANLTADGVNGAGGQRGFWVFANGATSFTYRPDTASRTPRLNLVSGWNLVSFAQASPVIGLQAQSGGNTVPLSSVVLPSFYQSGADNSLTVVDSAGSVDTARPYWIFASSDVTLTWGAAPGASPSPSASPLPAASPPGPNVFTPFPATLQSQEYNESGRPIARAANGDFVTVCYGVRAGETATSILARRFNAAGVPQGSEFKVNSGTTSAADPDISMNAAGDFVISWTQANAPTGVFAHAYRADGTSRAAEFRVNTTTGFFDHDPSSGMDESGNFVVSWNRQDAIYTRRFNADTSPRSGEARVSLLDFRQTRPATAMAPNGAYVVVFQTTNTQSDNGVWCQRYNANGAQQGEFYVPVAETGNQQYPSVCMDGSGNFVVAWTSPDGATTESGVFARRFGANGSPQTSEFLVNTVTARSQLFPSVAAAASGAFVIAWHTSIGQAGSRIDSEIRARRYSAAGVAQGGEIDVTNQPLTLQNYARVACDSVGNFVVMWRDPDANLLPARRYAADGTPGP